MSVTPPTIAKVGQRLKFTGHGYKKVVEKLLSEEKKDGIFEQLEEFLARIPATKGSSTKRQMRDYYKKKLSTKTIL